MKRIKHAVVRQERIGLEIYLRSIVTQTSGEVEIAFEVDAESECLDDLAEHLKTTGKDKVLRTCWRATTRKRATSCTIYMSTNYHLALLGKSMTLRYTTSYKRWKH